MKDLEMTGSDEKDNASPFHQGEQILQTKAGVREQTEAIGKRIIRPYMPDQHREFYTQLPFLIVGSVDDEGRPWASILPSNKGAVSSPNSRKLQIRSKVITGDPLKCAYHRENAAIGLLGIELHTRRRNRVNGFINPLNDGGIEFKVGQSFGNCPQYIQHRHFKYIRDADVHGANYEKNTFKILDQDARNFIGNADSFYVASAVKATSQVNKEGVDVSHRGGRPGFIKIVGNRLTIPDYPGNNLFNTLGNFLLNPKAGLLFTDFATGEIMMLTGTVELDWEKSEALNHFQGAQRSWTFKLEQGICIKDALPFRAALGEYSPNTLMTGTWAEATALDDQAKTENMWRPFKISKTVDETDNVRSFYLQSQDNAPLLPFKAGQHLLVKVALDDSSKPLVRAYSLSSAPLSQYYRISVKKELRDGVSQYLHSELMAGDTLYIKVPRGEFCIDPQASRRGVLIGAGVGITPMIAMASYCYNESIRYRNQRPLTIIQASSTTQERAFSGEFKHLAKASQGGIGYLSFVSKALAGEKPGVDFSAVGRLSANVYRQLLALDGAFYDSDFYLCGPASFMQSQYDALIELGVPDERIFAEAFGPASLQRQISEEMIVDAQLKPEAEQSLVQFSESNVEQHWKHGDETLLETAEAQGLEPEFSCRNGRCGACAIPLVSGEVTYRTKPTASVENNQVLICCAVPAEGSNELVLKL